MEDCLTVISGKSLFLWYVLFHRMCEKKPSAFQNEPEIIWTFEGGQVVSHSSSRKAVLKSRLPNGTQALCHCGRRGVVVRLLDDTLPAQDMNVE